MTEDGGRMLEALLFVLNEACHTSFPWALRTGARSINIGREEILAYIKSLDFEEPAPYLLCEATRFSKSRGGPPWSRSIRHPSPVLHQYFLNSKLNKYNAFEMYICLANLDS